MSANKIVRLFIQLTVLILTPCCSSALPALTSSSTSQVAPSPVCQELTGTLSIEDFITDISGKINDLPFRDCALVGSSSSLRKAGVGSEIDKHETIIRVNRVPQQHHFPDVGSRTDILFGEPGYNVNYSFFVANASNGTGAALVPLLGGKTLWCSLASGGPECPFRAIVFKGADQREGYPPWRERFPYDSPGWHPEKAAFTLAFQSDAANELAWATFRKYGGKTRPTNGFQAFMTFAPLCRKLTVYGFSGYTTYDGHAVSRYYHNLIVEHRLLARLLQGEVESIDFVWNSTTNMAQLDKEGIQKEFNRKAQKGCFASLTPNTNKWSARSAWRMPSRGRSHGWHSSRQ